MTQSGRYVFTGEVEFRVVVNVRHETDDPDFKAVDAAFERQALARLPTLPNGMAWKFIASAYGCEDDAP